MTHSARDCRIERILNNNVLIVLLHSGDEQILVGKGIGFGAKRGSTIDMADKRIEKRFSLVTEENQSRFQQLFLMVPPDVVGLAEEIITMATKTLACGLHEHIHVALADHIGFALSRLQGGFTIENPFLEEIRTLYADAWQVASMAARMIEDRYEMAIPDEEIGFLTLHLHSATHTRGLSETVRVADAVNLAITTIEDELGKQIPRNQLNYARLVIHLRFAIQRLLRDEAIRNPLAEAVTEKLPDSYQVATRAAAILSKRIGMQMPVDEVAYLALHIARLLPNIQESV